MKLELGRAVSLPRFGARTIALGAIVGVVAVGAYLRLYQLGEGGLGNPFYAATVRSMTKSFHNAFFVSFDPLGTFMADKPPLALWLQTLSALAFGYGGFALVLPQAIAGVAALVLVYILVRRTHDDFVAVATAATLAVLPASVLVSRNNTMDTLVMALSLGAALLALRAAASGRLAPLVLAGVLSGLAFNTKGFEAFIALPGIVTAFWLACELPRARRVMRLALWGGVICVVGLSWVTAVSLFPASERPLVLNSDGNSVWNLTFGYNGIDRVFGSEGFNPANALTTNSPGVIPIGVVYGGERGPLRVLGEFPGPLVAAAIPVALAGAALLVLDVRDTRRRVAAALWIPWLGAGLVAFSTSRLGSPHYLEAFSPAVAVCVGVAMREAVAGSTFRRFAALIGIAGSSWYALQRLTELGDAGDVIEMLSLVALAAAAGGLALALARPRLAPAALFFAPFACLLAILFAMSYQAIHDAPIEGVQPGAVLLSEDRGREVRFDPTAFAYSFITGNYSYLARPLSYLEQRSGEGGYLVGVRSFYQAAAIISQRDAAVLPLYSEFRNRPELPADKLESLIDAGTIRYLMISLPATRALDPAAAIIIESRCRENVSREAGLAPQTGLQLLHCS